MTHKTVKTIVVGAVLLLAAAILTGQQEGLGARPIYWRISPQYLTTTPTDVCTMTGAVGCVSGKTLWACQGDVSATAGTAATITIRDGQGTPVPFWSTITALSASAPSSYKIWEASGPNTGSCRPFPGGIFVSASANTTIYISIGGYTY